MTSCNTSSAVWSSYWRNYTNKLLLMTAIILMILMTFRLWWWWLRSWIGFVVTPVLYIVYVFNVYSVFFYVDFFKLLSYMNCFWRSLSRCNITILLTRQLWMFRLLTHFSCDNTIILKTFSIFIFTLLSCQIIIVWCIIRLCMKKVL
jgi:hypothetical protein